MPFNRDKTQTQPGQVTAPAVPASTTALTNNLGTDVAVYIIAATITVCQLTPPGGAAQTIYSQASGVANWCVILPANWAITLTYTGSPTWLWMAY